MSDDNTMNAIVDIEGMKELGDKASELAEAAERACQLAEEISGTKLEIRIRSSRS